MKATITQVEAEEATVAEVAEAEAVVATEVATEEVTATTDLKFMIIMMLITTMTRWSPSKSEVLIME